MYPSINEALATYENLHIQVRRSGKDNAWQKSERVPDPSQQ